MEILIDLSILVFSLAIGFALLVMIAIGCLLIPVSAIAGFALLVWQPQKSCLLGGSLV